jgi:tRNA threonylcarbamoyladenosine biosynthesis protein TsaE
VTGSAALFLEDEAASLALAARYALALPADGLPLVLYLHGELGAGKTTLARGMLRAMGEQGAVRSPTFALLAEYEPAGGRVLHIDLYRLDSAQELPGLGLADYVPGSRLWLVEWPERAAGGSGLPPPDAHVYIEIAGQARQVIADPVTERGRRWLASVGKEPG